MATPIAITPPVAGRAQPPIWPLIVGNNGGFLAVRSSPAQGACGVGSYPCKHPGVDVNGKRGTPVVSPTDGVIVATADGSSSPFGGYGPWVIVILGTDGRFHLLGHLDPSTSNQGPINRRVRAGDVIGTVSSANHTHWEVRKKMVPAFSKGETNFTNNLDPLAWLASAQSSSSWLLAGAAALLLVALWRR